MEKPLVSIVTITRNRADLLERCIKSILAQTYTTFEHIIVDGNSTDNTDEVVASFADSRIRYIKLNENLPLRESKRIALDAAKGKYYCSLDDDDEYLPTKIEKQISLIESLPEDYGLVVCWMTYYDAKTGDVIRIHKPQVRGNVLENVVEVPTISGTPSFFCKFELYKEVFEDIRDTGVGSDWATGVKFCERCKVDYVPESLVKVYVNHGHTRMTNADRYYADADKKMVKFHTYFLTTYAQVFAKYPDRGWYHYKGLVTYNLRLGNKSEVWKYYWKLIRYKPSVENFLMPIKYYTKKMLRWK